MTQRHYIPTCVETDGFTSRVDFVEVTTLHGPYDQRPTYGPEEPREHFGCGGMVVDHDGYFINVDGDEFNVDYKCTKCGETFMEPREWMFE